jgi:hypothetical protein
VKIFDLSDPAGHVYAFEVSNGLLGRRRACAIAAQIPGARMLRRPRLLSWLREDVFCEFKLGGVRFEINEPFGDNSRYWVGPVPTRPVPELGVVRTAFAAARPMAAFMRASG